MEWPKRTRTADWENGVLTLDGEKKFDIPKLTAEIMERLAGYTLVSDIRTVLDDRNEKIGRKIRDNELKKIPYMLIVGEQEMNENKVSVRRQGEGDKGSMTTEEFAEMINKEVEAQLNSIYNE